MGKSIFTFVEKCVACKGCEIACAVEHSASKTLAGAIGEVPRPRPRVHVESAGAFSYAARCQHCQDASCMAACPTGAMGRNPSTHAVQVDAQRCIGCWMCVTVCPFGAVSADPVTRTALKCDRCPERTVTGLDPACVAACPTHALVFATPDEIASMRRRATARAAAGLAPIPTPGTVALWRSLKQGASE